ncbi:hypothetical protein BpHYR1_032389, partial [Brachionus plicatilis]
KVFIKEQTQEFYGFREGNSFVEKLKLKDMLKDTCSLRKLYSCICLEYNNYGVDTRARPNQDFCLNTHEN